MLFPKDGINSGSRDSFPDYSVYSAAPRGRLFCVNMPGFRAPERPLNTYKQFQTIENTLNARKNRKLVEMGPDFRKLPPFEVLNPCGQYRIKIFLFEVQLPEFCHSKPFFNLRMRLAFRAVVYVFSIRLFCYIEIPDEFDQT